MERPKVAIVKGDNPERLVEESLSLIGGGEVILPEDMVLIKPNYVVAKHPSTGVTTDPRIIEGLIVFAKKRGVKSITVGEGGAVDMEEAFDKVGIRDVATRHRVELIDLNKDERMMVRIPDAIALEEVGVAKAVLERSCIINVPKLKIHHLSLITLCMKNLMGAVLPKDIMHTQIHEKITDLATIIKPRLNIIDGTVGSELHEATGRPVEMGIVIAGTDIVATDAVGAAVMGIDPRRVGHIRMAEERDLGVGSLERIEVVGEAIDDVRREFKLPI